MKHNEIISLKNIAYNVRRHIIEMARNGGCFIGSALSCVDIIVYLYKSFLKLDINVYNSLRRNYFFLSKGHAVPALYGTFVEIGFMSKQRLYNNHLKTNDYIYWHPNWNIKGVEFHSGSLGHLLSVSIGIAYDFKLRNHKNHVVVLLGDGELNEGSIWESILVSVSLELENLIIIIDRNKFQANIATENLIKLEPLKDKFDAFGCETIRINGHDFSEMEEVLSQKKESNKPRVIIADTVRGKGLPSIQDKTDKWFVKLTDEEAIQLLKELEENKYELTD